MEVDDNAPLSRLALPPEFQPFTEGLLAAEPELPDSREDVGPTLTQPTSAELPDETVIEAHRAGGHAIYAPWCGPCVAGAGREKAHPGTNADERRDGLVVIDYTFYGSDGKAVKLESQAAAKTITAVDRDTGHPVTVPCRTKGATDTYAILTLARWVANLGLKRVTLQSDGENPILAMRREVQATLNTELGLPCTTRESPSYDHQAAGAVEATGGHSRAKFVTLVEGVAERTGYTIPVASDLGRWAQRHASWVRGRLTPTSNGHTSYFNVHGMNYKGELCEFGETVRFKPKVKKGDNKSKSKPKFIEGVWAGKTETTDEHIVGNAAGVQYVRTVRRVPVESRWSAAAVKAFRGLPWKAKPDRAPALEELAPPVEAPTWAAPPEATS